MKAPIPFYDLQGFAFGILRASLGVLFLKAAGLAVLLSYVTQLGFGLLFMAISAPFMLLAWTRRGPAFTLRTLAAVAGISLLAPWLSEMVRFEALPTVLAAILAGSTAGLGLVALFRHNASAGGMAVLALVVEQRTGLRAGWFMMGFDALIFLSAAFVLPPDKVLASLLGVAVLNAIIAWNFGIAQAGAAKPTDGQA
ncbi:YitT family protein [Paracoccus bogoriensis]|uniref:YitT family protein n=1 Tax=Paracoccus bogoriensis TaxID=242065 RepID=UPI001CA5CAA3|nr:YitT family protein [Paracoccus bogoriensis]MBW7057927.1 YitT family protein [Paracoccus bogoriensis]